ncbi:hypothetical protein [Micromonospora sp. CB01531]|uniref:hypothetical protein n=1 Tax=Micromonospora sp. CB01531 TaxID=1718947 RepID=UPI00093CA14D|nr:hypothetical protein [Micromonospora sp. CB01531]OKI54515.1 hypothetical protein A6A27_31820 [Micromonospora sp. CB01531]
MKVLVAIQIEVDPEKWSQSNNGPWPEDDKRALSTAVRQDVKSYIQNLLDGAYNFELTDAKVAVR